jgi:hypothetical protein
MKKKSWFEFYSQMNEAMQPQWVNTIETMNNDQLIQLEKNLLANLKYSRDKKDTSMENESKQELEIFYKTLMAKYPNSSPQLNYKMNSILKQAPTNSPSSSSSQSPKAEPSSPSSPPSAASQKPATTQAGPYGSTTGEPTSSPSASKKLTVAEVNNMGESIDKAPDKFKALYSLALMVKLGKGS